jgi:hypothetical protein
MRRWLKSDPYTSKLFFEEKGTLCFLSRCCNIQILSFFYTGKGPYMIEWFRV